VRATLKRWALPVLVLIAGTASAPTPVFADTSRAKPIRAAVSAFSSASVRTVERAAAPKKELRAQSGGESFFKTRKGAVALGLMIGGAAFTVWSINHDRKPVKSPVR
jgi:hypothetical protein